MASAASTCCKFSSASEIPSISIPDAQVLCDRCCRHGEMDVVMCNMNLDMEIEQTASIDLSRSGPRGKNLVPHP
jgi:hypothetical protein